MAFKIPWSNFHELNLDWLLEKMKELEKKVDDYTGSAVPSDQTPLVDLGIGNPGTSVNYARGDHRHPVDTSRASQDDLDDLRLTVDGNWYDLQADIGAVDAKIKLSTAAPLVDGVASPGSSDYMARSDHVHPTDTSRASQTQVDTIQATLDSYAGSDSPYGGTPTMDGIGSPGLINAYSRGDHVHPSDTSKLDTAGGTISGNLIVQTLTRFKTVNAIGWLRIAQVPDVDGTKVVVHISRDGNGTESETHAITFTINNTAGKQFTDEISVSDAAYVNKIRYTDAGAIDVHIDQTYNANMGFFLEKYATTTIAQNLIQAIEPEWVDDAPAGETIVTEYNLNANMPDSGTGYVKYPDGTLMQWGIVQGITFTAETNKTGEVSMPEAYKDTNYVVTATPFKTGTDAYAFRLGTLAQTYQKFDWSMFSGDGSAITISGRGFRWFAIGKWK